MVRAANEKGKEFYGGVAIWCVSCWWLVSKDLGSIAFVGSVLLAIWFFGLRDKFDGEVESSAYSVFNKGGKAIMGGFTGQQLEEQLRGGTTSTHQQASTRVDDNVPLTTTARKTGPRKVSENEKVKRRAAAAAAAERRLEQTKGEM